MAVLDSATRVAIGALFQADASHSCEALTSLTKADIQAAIAAVDDWVVNNTSSFNGAIPLAARTNLTAAQKARLLLYVVRRRYETGA